jgi:hypothetical protein
MMLKFVKDNAVKFISPESSLIPILRHEGWTVEGETVAPDLEALRAEAGALGLKVHHKTGAEKLAELIAEAKAE